MEVALTLLNALEETTKYLGAELLLSVSERYNVYSSVEQGDNSITYRLNSQFIVCCNLQAY